MILSPLVLVFFHDVYCMHSNSLIHLKFNCSPFFFFLDFFLFLLEYFDSFAAILHFCVTTYNVHMSIIDELISHFPLSSSFTSKPGYSSGVIQDSVYYKASHGMLGQSSKISSLLSSVANHHQEESIVPLYAIISGIPPRDIARSAPY